MVEQITMKNVLKQKLIVKCKACGGTGVVQTGKRGKQPYCRVCDREGTHEYDLDNWDMTIAYEPIPVSVDMAEVCERAVEEVKNVFAEDLMSSHTDDIMAVESIESESESEEPVPERKSKRGRKQKDTAAPETTEEENDDNILANRDTLIDLGLMAYCV